MSPRDLSQHVHDHPVRLALTFFIPLVISWALVVYSFHERTSIAADRTQAIKHLCATQHYIADALEGALIVVRAERRDPSVPEATHRADDLFIAKFRKNLRLIRADFADHGSFCHEVGRG